MLYYYIMVDPDKPSHCKVGITKNPDQRLRSYRTANPACYFSYVNPIPDKSYETRLLDLLKDRFVVKSEYIRCPPKIVENIVTAFLEDSLDD